MTLSVLFFAIFIVAGIFVARRFHVFRKAKPCNLDAIQYEFVQTAAERICCENGPAVGEYLVNLLEKFPHASFRDLRLMYYADRDTVRARDGARLSANEYQEEFAAIHARAVYEHGRFIKFLLRALLHKLIGMSSGDACAAAYLLRQEHEWVLELLELCEDSNDYKD